MGRIFSKFAAMAFSSRNQKGREASGLKFCGLKEQPVDSPAQSDLQDMHIHVEVFGFSDKVGDMPAIQKVDPGRVADIRACDGDIQADADGEERSELTARIAPYGLGRIHDGIFGRSEERRVGK